MPTSAASPAASCRLPRAARLLRRADFTRCYQSGSRRSGASVVLHWVPGGGAGPRLGITVGRKVGGSVVRHRLKRWVREVYRQWPGRAALPARDLVFHLRPGAASADYAVFRGEIERLLAALAAAPAGGR
jgi:ribonuclease P protein component